MHCQQNANNSKHFVRGVFTYSRYTNVHLLTYLFVPLLCKGNNSFATVTDKVKRNIAHKDYISDNTDMKT